MDELDYLMARFNVYYDFVMQSLNASPDASTLHFIEIYKEHFKKPTEEAYANKNIKFLRAMNKELNNDFAEMTKEEKEELALLFKEKLGEDIYQTDAKRLKKVEQIKKRGEIKTKTEYSLIHQRVEEMYADDHVTSETELLNKLLADFIKKTD